MLELHIWGPAFSLPSIDPQCNAAVAYLNTTLHKDEWTVIASSNPLLSPTRQLPALRDGMTWVAGFRGIVEHLRKKSQGLVLDALLSDIEKAECTAFSAFLETHGQCLIDLSLYVSAKNFDAITRSTYATLLPFPMQYYTPGVIRSQAKARTAGLGVTALDVDTNEPPASAATPTGIPHTTASTQAQPSILTATEGASTFKLTGLVHDFLQPLQARLGSSRYFFGSDPSTLDCLAAGYLSLCLFPELPHSWLANEMRKEFPRMCGYLNDIRTPMLGKFVNANEVLAYTRGSSEREKTPATELPWGVVERGDLPWMSGFLVDCALDAVGLGRGAETRRRKLQEREQSMDPEDLERKRKVEAAIRSLRIRSVLTAVGGVAAFIGYCVWSGFLQIKLKEEVEEEEEEEEEAVVEVETKEGKDGDELTQAMIEGPSGFGLAGAILGLRRQPVNPDDSVEVEVEVEVEHDEDSEKHDENNEELSPEEEEDIANDIRAEEDEINELIAKDVEEDIEGKAE
ncbi:hypothetical protein Q9L58_000703 [Maublancomyces gigas]|uniref:Uncharacterized protein n=1 Tax=Discina gigas TaxID=1032678 RepID=A0ABR3GW20_9PEZI